MEPEPAQSIRDRIIAAADSLYAETDRRAFPTVDAVRKRARVNMNDASTGMKQWRRTQTATATPVPAQLPAQLQASCTSALVALWNEAMVVANESLRAAQVGWEAERQEADDLSRQMAAAYDLQASELEAAQREINRLNESAESMRDAAESMESALEAAERAQTLAETAAKQAEIKAAQIELRADELRRELNHDHDEISRLARETSAIHEMHARQIERLHTESKRDLEKERERFEHETERSQAAISQAVADAAALRGRLEVLEMSRTKRTNIRKKKTPNGAAKKM